MGERTAITWTTSTWNPWQGCTKISPGCKHCYMYRDKERYGQDPFTVIRSKPATFNGPLKWQEPRRIFTCSWSDFFHEAADPWRPEAWSIIRATPQHTYLILTKRPERMDDTTIPVDFWDAPWPHVWLGVSAETQEYADERIPLLLDTPAVVRFLSLEPLLGPIEFPLPCQGSRFWTGIQWVIVGGESGPHYRPMDFDWVRAIKAQCDAAGVAYFFKQRSSTQAGRTDGVPPELLVQNFPVFPIAKGEPHGSPVG